MSKFGTFVHTILNHDSSRKYLTVITFNSTIHLHGTKYSLGRIAEVRLNRKTIKSVSIKMPNDFFRLIAHRASMFHLALCTRRQKTKCIICKDLKRFLLNDQSVKKA